MDRFKPGEASATEKESDTSHGIRSPSNATFDDLDYITSRSERVSLTNLETQPRTRLQDESSISFSRFSTHNRQHYNNGRKSCDLGEQKTTNSIRHDRFKLHFHDISHHCIRNGNRGHEDTNGSGFLKGYSATSRRSPIQNHSTNGSNGDERAHRERTTTSQCNYSFSLEKGRSGQGYFRDSGRRSLEGSRGTHRDTHGHRFHSSYSRGEFRQSVMGGTFRSHTTSHRESSHADSSSFHLKASTHHSTPITTPHVSKNHHRSNHSHHQDHSSASVLTQHSAWGIANTHPKRVHTERMQNAVTSPLTRRPDAVPRDNRSNFTRDTPHDARGAVRHVHFYSFVDMCVFNVNDVPSELCMNKKGKRSKISFSPFVSVVVFEKKDSLIRPFLPSLLTSRDSPLSPLSPLSPPSSFISDSFLSLSSLTLPSKNSLSLSFPPHPPKIPRALFNTMKFLRYEIPQNFFTYTCIPHSSPKNVQISLSTPLKPVSTSCIDYSKLREWSHHISPSFASEYSSLIDIITDVSSFQKIFTEMPRERVTGKKSALTEEDLEKLKEWTIVMPIPRNKRPISSSFGFKVLKSDLSSTRFILDCRDLNERMIDPPTFHLPPPIAIIITILSCEFGSCSDFRSWFFQHALDPEVGWFFAFRVGPKWNCLLRLAQGWKFSPVISQKSSEIITFQPESIENHLSLVWIDNVFLGSRSEEGARERNISFRKRCDEAQAELGECGEVSTSVEYVGGEFDMKKKRWRLKESWIKKAITILLDLPAKMSPRRIWCIMGVILWFIRMSLLPFTIADPLIFFISRLAKRITSGEIEWKDHVEIWDTARDNISSFIPLFEKNAWQHLSSSLPFPPPSHLPLSFSDASFKGAAGVWRNEVCWTICWDSLEHTRGILYLEALAWEKMVQHLVERNITSFCTVTDSEPLFFSLIKTRSKNFHVNGIIHRTLMHLRKKHCLVYVGWIGTDKMPADAASRGATAAPIIPPVDAIKFSQFPIVCSFE